MAKEVTIYETGNTKITNLHAFFGAEVYPIITILSIQKKKALTSNWFPLRMVVAGILLIVGGFSVSSEIVLGMIFLGSLLLVAGLFFLTKKPVYFISLTLTNGDARVCRSSDEVGIDKVITALKSAKKG